MRSKIQFPFLGLIAAAMYLACPSAQAQPIDYFADLSGVNEIPATPSPGTGFASVSIDLTAHTLFVDITFSGLTGITLASHIHSPTASPGTGTAGAATQIPTFVGFPPGVTSGTYMQTFDTSSASTYSPVFLTANGGTPALAEAALASSLAAGTAYLDIHTITFPGGEIRGFFQPVPEIFSTLWMAFPVAGLLVCGRLRQKRA
jgi:hypothetical protein